MNKLEELNLKNPFPVFDIESEAFKSFGRVIVDQDTEEIIRCAEEKTGIPAEGNVYMPSFKAFEELEITEKIRDVCFGGMEIQTGYCNGMNSTFNGFEYNKASEIN